MKTPDHNFFNVTGDDTGNVWVNDTLTFTADEPGIRELRLGEIRPDKFTLYNDALKVSGVRRLRIFIDVVDGRGCLEDAIDINHSEDVEIFVRILYSGIRYCVTCKGASKRISIKVDLQCGHGKEADYDYGNDSDQSKGYTVDQMLDVTGTEDRAQARVRCLQADPIDLRNTGYRYLFPDPRAWYHRLAVNFLTFYFWVTD